MPEVEGVAQLSPRHRHSEGQQGQEAPSSAADSPPGGGCCRGSLQPGAQRLQVPCNPGQGQGRGLALLQLLREPCLCSLLMMQESPAGYRGHMQVGHSCLTAMMSPKLRVPAEPRVTQGRCSGGAQAGRTQHRAGLVWRAGAAVVGGQGA